MSIQNIGLRMKRIIGLMFFFLSCTLMVQVEKGWNNILVKAPVESFKGKDWQNPEKWMFTVVPVNDEF